MTRFALPAARRLWLLPILLLFLFGLGACGSQKIVFVYPDEELDFQLRNLKMPTVYVEGVTDMRPLAQREGEGKFFKITFPDDEAWEAPATQIYAEALVQDLAQTNLMELVPLQAQADYVLSMDLMSLGCQLRRSPASFIATGAIGAGAGMAFGDDASHRVKLAGVLAAASMLAIPVPTVNHAEADIRLVLKDRTGNILWQKSCLGEVDERKWLTATAREDQQLVNEHLTKAVKRANACLLGQLRQFLLENGRPASD